MKTGKGSLSTLNVGEGDITITFEGEDDAGIDKALDMLCDMQKRGYAILVRQEDGSFARAHSIDREARAYIVNVPQPATAQSVVLARKEGASEETQMPAEPAPQKGKRPYNKRKQGIGSSEAVGVARSAGG